MSARISPATPGTAFGNAATKYSIYRTNSLSPASNESHPIEIGLTCSPFCPLCEQRVLSKAGWRRVNGKTHPQRTVELVQQLLSGNQFGT